MLPSLLLAALAVSPEAGAGLTATADPALIASLDEPVFVDTRHIDTCARRSIDGALCMEPSQFLHPNGLPASFRDINWLAGTFGLDSDATAVVFGTDESDNEFVAGMLFLLGQSHVVIWRGGLRSIFDSRETGAGRLRAILRSLYFASPVRDGYVALDDDVRRFFSVGSASRVGFATTAKETDWTLASRATGELLFRREGDGSLLLLGDETRGAVAGFARLMLEHPLTPAQVHIDGLRGRDAESLGAPGEAIHPAILAAIVLGTFVVLCIALLGRRRAVGGPR